MKRFNPFLVFMYLLVIVLVILFTVLDELLTYLGKLIKKIRRNYRIVIHGRY